MPRSSVSVPAAAGFVVATPVVVWAAVGKHDAGDDYAMGPYRVPLGLEYAVAALAVVLLVGAVTSVVRRRGVADRLDVLAVGLVCFVAGLWAAAWRVVTAGGGGANIGAGLVFFAMPVLTGALFIAVVFEQHAHRPMSRTAVGSYVAGCVAIPVVLYSVIFA